jgi:hypothetical protein
MDFRIEPHLIENRQVSQRAEQLASQDRLEVDDLFRAVVELNVQGVRRFDLERSDAVDGMGHRKNPLKAALIQRIDGPRSLPRLKPLPIRDEFRLMHFGPGFHQASLSPRKRAGDQVDGIQRQCRASS